MVLSSVFCIALVKILLVAGLTASGKSAFALKLAQERNGAILNADSLQIYRGLEILTAHPSPEDQKKIPHHLYGFLELKETFSVGKWLEYALAEIQKIHEEGRLPIVVGGTGLYFKVLMRGISAIPSVDPAIRKNIEEPQEILYLELQRIDPLLAARISSVDRQRTLRGLEVFYGTGKTLSFWQSQKPVAPPFDFEKFSLLPSREDLYKRIETRIEMMIEQGVLEEVRSALALNPSSNAIKAIGLREFGAYLEGKNTLEEAKQLVILHTRQYAKRQRTWFRYQF